MRIIAVDDEKIALEALSGAIRAIVAEDEVVSFRYHEDAIEYAKENLCDIAFLDIEMVGMSGVELAEELKKYNNEIKIVFCTGYGNYRDVAFDLHASGYLMKPISAEDVQAEINNIKGVRQKEKPLTVKCFGNFEVYVKDEKLVFKRLKTKELLAFLVDRKGAGMTAREICAVLFPDDMDDTKNAAYLRQLVMDLKNTLKAVGAEGVLRHETPCYRVDTSLIQCDYFSYLETGKPEFYGEYMMQYSWAEETCALL